MTNFSSILIGFIFIIIFVFLLTKFILNEKQIYQLKYGLYVGIVMIVSILIIPIFVIRPRNAFNIRLSSLIVNPIFYLFGITYRIENGEILQKQKHGVIVANHQSSIDFIGMMKLWPQYIRYCTILAKKELIWAIPFGITAWLAGVEFVDRNNRQRSSETMRHLTDKVKQKSLKLWIFPEGTRSMKDTLLPFKFGAFRVAIEAQVPIVPVVFSCYKSIYNADKETKSYYWRRGCVTIKCLEPIETKGMTIENDLQQLTDLTRQRMIEAYKSIQTITSDKQKCN